MPETFTISGDAAFSFYWDYVDKWTLSGRSCLHCKKQKIKNNNHFFLHIMPNMNQSKFVCLDRIKKQQEDYIKNKKQEN